MQLRPTSPLRSKVHVDQAIRRLLEHPEADSIRTVCIPFQNPYKMWRIAANGFMQPLLTTDLSEAYNLPRQALPEVFWQTGYVDAAWTDTILEKNSMTGENILPLIIAEDEWIDIDSVDDWRRAERLLESGELTMGVLGYEVREKNQ